MNRSIPLVVLAAIRIRAGPTLKLVFEFTGETAQKSGNMNAAKKSAAHAGLRAHEKKDQMVLELAADMNKLNLAVV